jgi:hypothetical protein
MKTIAVLILSITTLQSYSQCSNCTSIEEALKDPQKVKTIKINPWQHKITLESLPNSIGEFVNAEVIYLSDHNISSIPNTIGNLQKLKELSFSGCQLTELPDELFSLKNLNELILLNNQFTQKYIIEVKKRFRKEMPNTKVLISGAE